MSQADNLAALGSNVDSSGVLQIASGGTGATSNTAARTNLGLGTIATQNANNVSITGGSITGANLSGATAINASNITSGTVATARLASGTANSSTYLRGDQTWATVTPAAVSDQLNTSTGYFSLPIGTTAQRPASPQNGFTRFNSTTGYPEWWSDATSSWVPFYSDVPYSVDALVVAGGGGGGAGSTYLQTGVGNGGGGGGAGGFRTGSLQLSPGTAYTITVGAGGTAGSANTNGGQGGNSSVSTLLVSTGGGGGGTAASGGSGGSGGGGSTGGASGGSGTSGQGFRGGNVTPYSTSAGAGGGGSASAGVDFTSSGNYQNGTAGGNGTANLYSGASVTYAAGGGGGYYAGGNAGYSGSNGASNTGNGASAGGGSDTGGGWYNGGTGGSGIVIIRYLGSQRGTGGTVTSSGGYTIHTFTTSGTYTA